VQFVSTLAYYTVLSTCYKTKFKPDQERNARIEEAAARLVEATNIERGESRADSLARNAYYSGQIGGSSAQHRWSNRTIPMSEADIVWFS